MDKVVQLFEDFEEQTFIYTPTTGEVAALQTIATYVSEKFFSCL